MALTWLRDRAPSTTQSPLAITLDSGCVLPDDELMQRVETKTSGSKKALL
jgi:hypothetical protein